MWGYAIPGYAKSKRVRVKHGYGRTDDDGRADGWRRTDGDGRTDGWILVFHNTLFTSLCHLGKTRMKIKKRLL